jgi:hypothetical protein
MHVRIQKVPALALAAALQILPIARVACVNQAAAPSGFAIVFRWCAGAVALLGSYHAVSGASAAIAGMQNLSPVGPLTTNAAGTVGKLFVYRIVVTNPGQNPDQAYYNAYPLPPGLTINTNLAANGGTNLITGVPTTAGVYPVTLVAGNANYVGVVTLGATITISGSGGTTPPQITGPPTNQTVQAGTNVTFIATATGTSPLSYSWKFGSTVIAGATTSSLQLQNVQTTNGGSYTVTVTNSAGSASATASLTVNAPAAPPSITTQPQNQTVTNGNSAAFSVVASGSAPLNYQWIKDNAALAGATTSSYTVSAASTNNAGAYSVVVTNSSGSLTSSVATLTVLVPPTIVTPPQSLTVTSGAPANFSVVAAGLPAPAYQWKFNGTNIVGATLSSYTIASAQPVNGGDYAVLVSNSSGAVTSSAAHLTVQQGSTTPFQISTPQWSNNAWTLQVSGPAQTNYVLWRSANLSTWTPIKTNFSATGTTQFSDSTAPTGAGFYRTTLSP